jgi:predicted transcriptional regulator
MARRSLVEEWRYAVHTTNRLGKNAKTVALHLSVPMSDDGFCFVSGDTLERRTGMARSTVFEAVKELRCRGWVKVGKERVKYGAAGRVNTYTATFPEYILERGAPDVE